MRNEVVFFPLSALHKLLTTFQNFPKHSTTV
jgi:hypothetical protein